MALGFSKNVIFLTSIFITYTPPIFMKVGSNRQTLLKNSNEHNAPIDNAVGQAEGLIQIIYFLGIQIQKSSPNPAHPFNASGFTA